MVSCMCIHFQWESKRRSLPSTLKLSRAAAGELQPRRTIAMERATDSSTDQLEEEGEEEEREEGQEKGQRQ